MFRGRIKAWLGERNFGFVRADDGRELFFPGREFLGEGAIPYVGQRVEFDLADDARAGKPKAIGVYPA